MSARFIFLLKSRSKVSRERSASRKRACLEAARDEPILTAHEFVADERRDEIDRRLFLGLRLAEARFEDYRHAGETKLSQSMIELNEIHTGSPVWRSMRSR